MVHGLLVRVVAKDAAYIRGDFVADLQARRHQRFENLRLYDAQSSRVCSCSRKDTAIERRAGGALSKAFARRRETGFLVT